MVKNFPNEWLSFSIENASFAGLILDVVENQSLIHPLELDQNLDGKCHFNFVNFVDVDDGNVAVNFGPGFLLLLWLDSFPQSF